MSKEKSALQILSEDEKFHAEYHIDNINNLIKEATVYKEWTEKYSDQLAKCKELALNESTELQEELKELALIRYKEPKIHTAFLFCDEEHDLDLI